MQVSLPVSNETAIIGSDNRETCKELPMYSNFSLIIHADNKEEADRIFNELSKDGQAKMPTNLTFRGSHYGICIGKFGITWKITM